MIHTQLPHTLQQGRNLRMRIQLNTTQQDMFFFLIKSHKKEQQSIQWKVTS